MGTFSCKAGDKVIVTVPGMNPFCGTIVCYDNSGYNNGGSWGLTFPVELILELKRAVNKINGMGRTQIGVYTVRALHTMNAVPSRFHHEVGLLPFTEEYYFFCEGEYFYEDELTKVIRTIRQEVNGNVNI